MRTCEQHEKKSEKNACHCKLAAASRVQVTGVVLQSDHLLWTAKFALEFYPAGEADVLLLDVRQTSWSVQLYYHIVGC